ncbi:MAG: FHA domain-containing protein, partial [Bdellovibrionales bacterium]|nr:FHA domain-containing protein [Bdellovibrionales bacterium]
MYKLVAVAGRLRGQEFPLENDTNTIGRDSENDIFLDVDGVSKQHLRITVTDDVAYLEDMGSSNGTFINDNLVKRATVKNGDRITLPDLILQVVHVREKKIIVKKQIVDHEDEERDFLTPPVMPEAIPGKLLHLFKYRLMPVLHGINKEYEWKFLFTILLTAFIFVTISLTIFPVLQDSKRLLLYETAKRGAHYAEEIARLNNKALERRDLDRVDTAFLDNEPGVSSYELFDLEGRIVRPIGKMNEYIADTFSIKAREWAVSTGNQTTRVYKKALPGGQIGISQKILAYDARTGVFEPVGVIAIRFAPRSLAIEAARNSKVYLEALTTSAIVAVIFFGVVYYLTVRPVDELYFQLEEGMRGKRKSIECTLLMSELKGLTNSINTLLQKNRELSRDEKDDSFQEMEEDFSYVNILTEFLT